MGRKTESGDSPDALFSCRLHAPRTGRGHCLPEPRSRLRHSVPSHGRDLVHHRGRSQTSGGRDRILRRPAHLGAESSPSSPPTLCRPGWRNLARWHPVDSLPPPFLLARTGAVPLVPPIVLDVSAGGFRCWQTQVFLFLQGPSRSAGFPPASRSAAQREMGRLRQGPFAGPQQVVDYVGRYTHRVAISNHRIADIEDGQVTFNWRDYRDNNQQKIMTLSAEEFIRRFLLHVLPSGFHRIRYYGFLGNRYRKEKLEHCYQLLGMTPCNESSSQPQPCQDYRDRYEKLTGHSLRECPVCHCGRMITVKLLAKSRSPPAIADRP